MRKRSFIDEKQPTPTLSESINQIRNNGPRYSAHAAPFLSVSTALEMFQIAFAFMTKDSIFSLVNVISALVFVGLMVLFYINRRDLSRPLMSGRYRTDNIHVIASDGDAIVNYIPPLTLYTPLVTISLCGFYNIYQAHKSGFLSRVLTKSVMLAFNGLVFCIASSRFIRRKINQEQSLIANTHTSFSKILFTELAQIESPFFKNKMLTDDFDIITGDCFIELQFTKLALLKRQNRCFDDIHLLIYHLVSRVLTEALPKSTSFILIENSLFILFAEKIYPMPANVWCDIRGVMAVYHNDLFQLELLLRDLRLSSSRIILGDNGLCLTISRQINSDILDRLKMNGNLEIEYDAQQIKIYIKDLDEKSTVSVPVIADIKIEASPPKPIPGTLFSHKAPDCLDLKHTDANHFTDHRFDSKSEIIAVAGYPNHVAHYPIHHLVCLDENFDPKEKSLLQTFKEIGEYSSTCCFLPKKKINGDDSPIYAILSNKECNHALIATKAYATIDEDGEERILFVFTRRLNNYKALLIPCDEENIPERCSTLPYRLR